MITVIHDQYDGIVQYDTDIEYYDLNTGHKKALYSMCKKPPNYPVPSLIGQVYYLPDLWDHAYGEWVITDVDETFDPRLCMIVYKYYDDVIDDYPHDSPNYR